jgi:hypothetical protein
MSDADVAEGVFGTGRCRKLETSPVVARIAARKAPLENRGIPALRSASLPDAVPGRFQYAGSFSVSRRFVPRLFGRDSVLRSAADRGRHGDNIRSAVSVSRSSDEAAVSFRMSMSKVRVGDIHVLVRSVGPKRMRLPTGGTGSFARTVASAVSGECTVREKDRRIACGLSRFPFPVQIRDVKFVMKARHAGT